MDAARNERRSEPPPAQADVPASSTVVTTVASDGSKRYACTACPYATDRRDLFTRHENIHRDEKPFHCYLCQKQFNRADHVKKHFLRMHREHTYDINRIRRLSSVPKPTVVTVAPPQVQQPPPPVPTQQYYVKPPAEPPPQVIPTLEYRGPPIKVERVPLIKADPVPTLVIAPPPQQKQPAVVVQAGTIVSGSGGGGSSGGGGGGGGSSGGSARRKGERRYSCCYCSWSGVDNWCLKRHLNTHLKPFACALCEYKAARAERLATHVHKVHNKKACAKCPFLADDQAQLAQHLRETQ